MHFGGRQHSFARNKKAMVSLIRKSLVATLTCGVVITLWGLWDIATGQMFTSNYHNAILDFILQV